MMDVWTTRKSAVFIHDGDQKLYLSCIKVRDVKRGKSFVAVCPYCGRSDIGLGECRGCGATVGRPSYTATESTARLVCLMPFASEVLCMKSGSRIDILNKPHGRLDRYDEGEIAVKLTNCSIINLAFPVLADRMEDEAIEAHVDISCNIEIVTNAMWEPR